MLSYDFHLHSTFSDGQSSLEEILAQARSRNMTHLALTDHDTTAGQRMFLREAARAGMHAVSGIEMSTCDGDLELHMLGYGFEWSDVRLEKWLRQQKAARLARAKKILAAFRAAGFTAGRLTQKKTTIGRPHIVREISRYAENRRLIRERYACEPVLHDVIAQLTHKPGQPFYIKKTMLPIRTAIETIHRIGGIAVLAHPGYYELSPRKLSTQVSRLADMGLDGVEVFHADYAREVWKSYLQLAKKNRLLVSCGSDTHDLSEGGVGAIIAPKRVVTQALQPFLNRLWGDR